MIIQLENISKKYKKREILKNINISVEDSEIIGIIGANGTGKSTLLKIMLGLTKQNNGIIKYFNNGEKISSLIGYVPQENPLIPELTVLDNLKLWYSDSKENMNDDLNNGILKKLKLNDVLKFKVNNLSGGYKRRLSIGCALAKHPKLILLDEPSSGLDLNCKYEIKEYLKDYVAAGGSVVMVTHDLSEISICNKIYILKDGRLNLITETYEEFTEDKIKQILL